jgi:hypothetical protein
MKRRFCAGYSLVEACVCVVILGVSAFAFVSLSSALALMDLVEGDVSQAHAYAEARLQNVVGIHNPSMTYASESIPGIAGSTLQVTDASVTNANLVSLHQVTVSYSAAGVSSSLVGYYYDYGGS